MGSVDVDDAPSKREMRQANKGTAAGASRPAATQAIVQMTVDSSPEPERKKKRKRSESSESRSSSSSARRRHKRKMNNFSSVRNHEKERAKTRQFRSEGAAAAAKMVGTDVAGPYFAP